MKFKKTILIKIHNTGMEFTSIFCLSSHFSYIFIKLFMGPYILIDPEKFSNVPFQLKQNVLLPSNIIRFKKYFFLNYSIIIQIGKFYLLNIY